MTNPDTILSIVSSATDVPRKAILGKSRIRRVALARQMAMALMRSMCKDPMGKPLSYDEIGKFLGDLDHGTVIHGCKAIQNLSVDIHNPEWQLFLTVNKYCEALPPAQTFNDLLGSQVLLRNGSKAIEANIDRLSKGGDLVRLIIDGKASWHQTNHFTILEKL